jgi:hypothetical protein
MSKIHNINHIKNVSTEVHLINNLSLTLHSHKSFVPLYFYPPLIDYFSAHEFNELLQFFLIICICNIELCLKLARLFVYFQYLTTGLTFLEISSPVWANKFVALIWVILSCVLSILQKHLGQTKFCSMSELTYKTLDGTFSDVINTLQRFIGLFWWQCFRLFPWHMVKMGVGIGMFGLRWFIPHTATLTKKDPCLACLAWDGTTQKRPLSGMFGLRWHLPHTATHSVKDPCLACLAWDGSFPTQPHLQKKTPVWNVWPEMAPSPHTSIRATPHHCLTTKIRFNLKSIISDGTTFSFQ